MPIRITLYELLKLSSKTHEALREALAVAEVFAIHVEATEMKEKLESLQISNTACIYFTPEDMQVKGQYDKPLCFTGYIWFM